ncbi:MAG: hypothetical protein KC420_14290, partial [Myxococcales bacterium]|nr:hypothetical protein [Myxococcales bacterium]
EDPLASSSAGLQSTTFGSEVAGAAGFGMLTGGLAMLYAAQIMDAYATAAGKENPTPFTRHRLSAQVTRMATIGLKAGDPAADFYADWSVSVMGQVARRFSVGLADLGVKYGYGRTSIQAGPRLHYRFYDRGRVWLGAGAGVILQGTIGPREQVLANTVTVVSRNNGFAAIPYGLLDVRLFILDRWSLDLVPRISAPFGTRFYRGDGALPSRAVTFELGTGVGVYF